MLEASRARRSLSRQPSAAIVVQQRGMASGNQAGEACAEGQSHPELPTPSSTLRQDSFARTLHHSTSLGTGMPKDSLQDAATQIRCAKQYARALQSMWGQGGWETYREPLSTPTSGFKAIITHIAKYWGRGRHGAQWELFPRPHQGGGCLTC